ncbi:MAG TPA: ABC transporter permease [Longimicrobium sp.]|nr:ABC transporter permease [Longimicrobium sp.]
MLNRARLWIRSVVLRRRLEREMQEEMAEHLERATARLMARGLSVHEARREARREFGNVAWLQEEARFARGTRWLDALTADCRFALRHFARKRGTVLTMFVVLAVGMAISTVLFSVVHSYARQPPVGVARAEGLVRIRGSQSAGVDGRQTRAFSHDELLEYRELTGHFAAVGGWTDTRVALDAGDDMERRGLEAQAVFVTESYFSVLGVRPMLGPGLARPGSDDPAGSATAVIGHAAWDQLFGRSPEVIGSTIDVNGVPVTIAGVAPEGFQGVRALATFQLWIPLSAWRQVMPDSAGDFRAVARLRPGVDEDEATAAVQVVAARIAAAGDAVRPRVPAGGREVDAPEPSAEVVPLLVANGDPMFDRDVRLLSLSVGFLGLLVVLITCTNVSALLTGLATARRQEIAVRLSLGAARGRLIRQLLTETVLLAAAAGAAALGIAGLLLRGANRLPEMPLKLEVTGAAVVFTFGVALAVGILFGLSPALHATRLALAGALRDSSATIAGTRARLQRGLVVAQIAFTMPLVVLVAALLLFLLREYRPQRRTALADRVVELSVSPPASPGSPAGIESRERLRAATDRVMARLRTTPGVEAAVVDWGPTPPYGPHVVHPADRAGGAPGDVVELSGETAAEGYFGVMGIPLVRGRAFTSGDTRSGEPRPGDAAVVVGADLARRLWGGADAIGRRLQAADSAGGTLVVVGVVEDPQAETRRPGAAYRVFLPPDTSRAATAILLRTAASAEPLIPALRQAVQEEAVGMAVQVRTLAQIEDIRRMYFTNITGGLSAAGLMALLLSAIGLYAVVAFSVSQRTGEIAVRIAVGARARQIARRFIADGLRLSAFGLALGLPVSLVGLRFLMTLDDDIPAVPLPLVTVVAGLGVVLVATAAAWIPARRAASVDPAIVLRGE